jgi:hypothetical protein
MLEKVRYRDYQKNIDVSVYTDGYAYDNYSNLYLLSVAGHDAKVKAITSALVSGGDIEIVKKNPIYLSSDFSQKYRILSTKLDSGLLHQIALVDSFFKSYDKGSKLIYVDNERNAPEIIYNTIKNKLASPMIPKWAEWFYKKLKHENCLEDLLGTRKIIKLFVSEEELDSFISEGVKNGEIRF